MKFVWYSCLDIELCLTLVLFCSLCISYETKTYTSEICGGVAAVGLVSASAAAAGLSALTVVTGGLGLLAGVLILVVVTSTTHKILNYRPERLIDSYVEVLDLAIREAKEWKPSAPKAEEATESKKQEINEEELERQGRQFDLVKPCMPFSVRCGLEGPSSSTQNLKVQS
jgi:hypothetical protein